jgi:hypothetical protein
VGFRLNLVSFRFGALHFCFALFSFGLTRHWAVCWCWQEVLEGVLLETAHGRAAALATLAAVECFTNGEVPASGQVAGRLFAALHDDDEANATAARELWEVRGGGHTSGGPYLAE